MIRLPLTSFVDFVQATGMARVATLKKAQKQKGKGYAKEKDYYMLLRGRLIGVLKDSRHIDELFIAVERTGVPHKKKNYKECISGITTFIRTNNIKWCGSVSGEWGYGGLSVNVNPELGLEIGGIKYAVRVYFKKDELMKIGKDSILYLIDHVIEKSKSDHVPAILDARSGKFITKSNVNPLFSVVLESEAAAVVSMWNNLDVDA